jgi:hypothetical protein
MGPAVQLHQGPGGTPPSGGSTCGSCQAEISHLCSEAEGHSEEAGQVDEMGIFFHHGNFVYSLLAWPPGSCSTPVLQ